MNGLLHYALSKYLTIRLASSRDTNAANSSADDIHVTQ